MQIDRVPAKTTSESALEDLLDPIHVRHMRQGCPSTGSPGVGNQQLAAEDVNSVGWLVSNRENRVPGVVSLGPSDLGGTEDDTAAACMRQLGALASRSHIGQSAMGRLALAWLSAE